MSYDSAMVGTMMNPVLTLAAIYGLWTLRRLGTIKPLSADKLLWILWTIACTMQGLFIGAALNAQRIFFH